MLDALEGLAELPRERAVAMLGVSAGQAGEVEVDAGLRRAPAAPAAEIYAGVLYDHLGLADLPAAVRRRVLIASALWGVVGAEDRIPYAAAWKPRRAALLAVRAFTESGGKRKPVSHMAKAVRGDVARALLLAKEPPANPESAAATAETAGFAVELSAGSLDVIV